MPPVPSPKVMLVAVPPPVAPIVSVRPLSGGTAAVRVVVPAVRPSLARPEPLVTRSLAVPVCSVIAPPTEIVEGTAVPVIASIAVMMSAIVPVVTSMSRVPAAAEPVVPPPLLKLMVVPLTTMVSAAVKSVVTELVLAPPDSKVAPVAATGTVRLFMTAEPGVAAASVGAPVPRRSLAVAPVIAVVAIVDLVE